MNEQEKQPSISSAAASPANPSPWRVGREDEKTTVFYGRKCFALSASLARLGSFVKTYLASCALQGKRYVRNWSVKDTLSPYLIMKLRLSVPRTGESVCSLWPTAEKRGNIAPEKRNGLSGAIRLWLTPSGSDGKRATFSMASLRKGKESGNLSQQLARLARQNAVERLNPEWIEQLMGFPVGWTDADAAISIREAHKLEKIAPPGYEQYPNERPRTTKEKMPHRADRLKALGNAVVPQQAYPIFAGIAEIEKEEKTWIKKS